MLLGSFKTWQVCLPFAHWLHHDVITLYGVQVNNQLGTWCKSKTSRSGCSCPARQLTMAVQTPGALAFVPVTLPSPTSLCLMAHSTHMCTSSAAKAPSPPTQQAPGFCLIINWHNHLKCLVLRSMPSWISNVATQYMPMLSSAHRCNRTQVVWSVQLQLLLHS